MTATAKPNLADNWMGGYAPPSGFFDEFLDTDGAPRPHWQRISNHLGSLDQASWQRRERQLQRLIHDNGITYNVYGDDKQSKLRPWSMDMIPLAISQGELERLETSLGQRAHLLNLILQDVYGRQTMLQSSKMHPYLVFANPSFLRPCHGLLPPRSRHIQIYAADLARSPDGHWWVLSDRVEAASGLGYALENRMLMSRIFPKAIWDADILSLQPFIQRFCQHIESLAATNAENPNIALLTAGPHNETYFEQSFLARNLGYTLAEGEDLTVRSNRLYMKSISGAQRIHGLLRRVDSSWVDPLELRNESLLGVPGLANAIRQGNVSVLNALGSGFVETPALLAFLPWFCRNYLGESLEIPSVATWWCGQEKEREYVLENLDTLVIKPTFGVGNEGAYFVPQMSRSERAVLADRIKRFPERYCGQEIVSQATTPVYCDGCLQSRHFLVRVFLVPDGAGWSMMPGGLVRYAASDRIVNVSMQRGGESKDAWVVRDPKTERGERAKPHVVSNVPLRRSHNDLPSRTADNLFWLGRYVERSEALARLLRTLCTLLTEEIGAETQLAALPFLDQLIKPDESLEPLIDKPSRLLNVPNVEQLLLRSLCDPEDSESLVSNLRFIERAAAKVKERLSLDTWKRMQALRDLATPNALNPASIFDDEVFVFLDAALENLAIFVGNISENMTRSQGWRFLQLGRRIERGLAISAILKSSFAKSVPYSEALIAQLLHWADSVISYRRRYLNTLTPQNALELLCFDNNNPRALIYQASRIQDLIAKLPQADQISPSDINRLALQFFSRIGLSDAATLLDPKPPRRQQKVEEFFQSAYDNLLALASALERQYFAHAKQVAPPKAHTYLG